jgi:hypothetical protein
MAFFFFEEVDRGGGDCFVYVAAAEAGAVCAVPIAFDNHGATAAGACAREVGVHAGRSFQRLEAMPSVGTEV